LVYDELRRLAAQKLAQEKPGQPLEATGLVHEAYLRLVGDDPSQPWNSRGHFCAAAAAAMRRILIERARREGRRRHGGAVERHDLDAVVLAGAGPQTSDELIALSDALDALAVSNPQAAELVKLRFFAGLTNEEASAMLGISPRKGNQVW